MKKIKRKKRTEERTKKVWKLIEQWARSDAHARYSPVTDTTGKVTDFSYIDSATRAIKLEDEIRGVVLGEPNLYQFAKKCGFVKDETKKKRKSKNDRRRKKKRK